MDTSRAARFPSKWSRELNLLIWFLRDLDLLSVLARAAMLACEALLLGGVAFLLVVVRPVERAQPSKIFAVEVSGLRHWRLWSASSLWFPHPVLS